MPSAAHSPDELMEKHSIEALQAMSQNLTRYMVLDLMLLNPDLNPYFHLVPIAVRSTRSARSCGRWWASGTATSWRPRTPSRACPRPRQASSSPSMPPGGRGQRSPLQSTLPGPHLQLSCPRYTIQWKMQGVSNVLGKMKIMRRQLFGSNWYWLRLTRQVSDLDWVD